MRIGTDGEQDVPGSVAERFRMQVIVREGDRKGGRVLQLLPRPPQNAEGAQDKLYWGKVRVVYTICIRFYQEG